MVHSRPAELEYLDIHQHWQVTSWGGTPVVVFDDERAVLTALWETRQLGRLGTAPVLVHLDAHHDQWPMPPDAEAAWRDAVRAGDRRQVAMAVEFDVGCDDADWVRAAVAAGLVADVVTFYVTERPDPPPLPAARSVLLGKLSAELGPDGRLSGQDGAQIPGWDGRARRFSTGPGSYVLSIDLDAFTTDAGGGVPRPWPAGDVKAELLAVQRHGSATVCARDVLRDLAAAAALVTIAREPAYCGGDLAAAGLLRVLDEAVFDGALQAG
jgi:hypothetical protein